MSSAPVQGDLVEVLVPGAEAGAAGLDEVEAGPDHESSDSDSSSSSSSSDDEAHSETESGMRVGPRVNQL